MKLSITNDIVVSKFMINGMIFNFEIVNFPFLDEDALCSPYMVYMFRSLFVLQERVLMLVTSTRETFLIAKLSKQYFRYHKFEMHFLNSNTNTQSYLLNTTLV